MHSSILSQSLWSLINLSSYVAGTIDGSADNLKITKLDGEHYGLAFSAAANPDGSMYRAKMATKRNTTGKLYKSLPVRHWDKYVLRQRNAIWYGVLTGSASAEQEKQKFSLSTVTNALKDTALESPMPPFGGTDHFDISKQGLIFVAKDPELDPALNTKCNFYFVSLETFSETAPSMSTINLGDVKGALTCPVFSKDGSKAAFLAMRKNGYEADRNQIFIIPDVDDLVKIVPLHTSTDGDDIWDHSPSDITWTSDGSGLLLVAEHFGRSVLYHLPLNKTGTTPTELALDGSVGGIVVLKSEHGERVFISSNSLIDSSHYSIISFVPSQQGDVRVMEVSSLSNSGSMFGLDRSQIDEIWFPGAGPNPNTEDKVHALIMKPSDFDKTKRYPLAFLVHGGPQGAWTDSWSTRWNPALFAEQGYVVVCPNPTGSTGYGQAFTDAIQNQWGGLPYEDLVNCFSYLEDHVKYIDTERAVALGASYGGFMMNWMQGHALGRKFKALVTHDGVFSTSYELATDELYFIERDLGSAVPDNDNFREWDPARFVEHWETPHLVIHSELDYRLLMGDGLAAFNMLQARGVESEFLTFPDENHFVLKPENALVWQETVFNFINRHVGLPAYREGDEKEVVQDPPRGGSRGIVEVMARFEVD